MIYEGPIPEAVKARLAKAAEAGPDAQPDEAEGPGAARVAVLAVTLAVGLGLGLLLRPPLDRALGAKPPPPAVLAQAMPAPLRPEVDTSAIPGAEEISASAPLPVARAETLTAARASVRTAPPAKGRPAVVKVSAQAPAARTPTARISGDACMASASRADQLICADPVLAAADRDLGRAAERAAEAGGHADALDWLVTREAAARRSPQALAEAYRRRIAELRSLADPPH